MGFIQSERIQLSPAIAGTMAVGVLLAAFVGEGSAQRSSHGPPSWLQLKGGRHAFLSPHGSRQQRLCDSMAHYEALIGTKHLSTGCRAEPAGSAVQIDKVQEMALPGQPLKAAVAHVCALHDTWCGYVMGAGLIPAIPKRSIVTVHLGGDLYHDPSALVAVVLRQPPPFHTPMLVVTPRGAAREITVPLDRVTVDGIPVYYFVESEDVPPAHRKSSGMRVSRLGVRGVEVQTAAAE